MESSGAEHNYARLIEEIKQVCKNSYEEPPFYCYHCSLPTNNKPCPSCNVSYCERSYYCKKTKDMFYKGCTACRECHYCCCVCNKVIIDDGYADGCSCGAKVAYFCDHFGKNECNLMQFQTQKSKHCYCEAHKEFINTCAVTIKKK